MLWSNNINWLVWHEEKEGLRLRMSGAAQCRPSRKLIQSHSAMSQEHPWEYEVGSRQAVSTCGSTTGRWASNFCEVEGGAQVGLLRP
jgi:hypothetical protein